MNLNISVVIPVYTNEPTLPGLVGRLVKCLEEVTQNFEILHINDYGTVGTSNCYLFKLAKLSMLVLTAFNSIPLKLTSLLRFFLTIFRISIFSGAQLFGLEIFSGFSGYSLGQCESPPA